MGLCSFWGCLAAEPSLPESSPCQAVLVDRTIYISGQIGMDPSSGQLVSGGVAEEAKQALKNMGEILKAAGCDFTNVVKTTVLLADINDFSTVNEIYKQYFKSNFPARAAYQVAALPKGSRIEIEAVAVQGPLTTASL
ncbi:2-iminobutanoate/2-iminopropanoate deaminase isoform X2 [Symphalangus syndactylus]|uniref:2-iminobutanoate/2-iminopropanoate deaminase isoform X2 n=1 Tax=Symphalangus syndactylus TaxID=9590 RepID=UPI00300720D6